MVESGIIIGYIAGSCIVLSNLFQISQMIKSKKNDGLSLAFVLLNFVIDFLFIVSGVLLDISFLYVTNSVIISEQIVVMILYLINYRRNKNKKIQKNNQIQITSV